MILCPYTPDGHNKSGLIERGAISILDAIRQAATDTKMWPFPKKEPVPDPPNTVQPQVVQENETGAGVAFQHFQSRLLKYAT